MDEFDSLKNEYDKVIDMLRNEMADVKRLEDELAELKGEWLGNHVSTILDWKRDWAGLLDQIR